VAGVARDIPKVSYIYEPQCTENPIHPHHPCQQEATVPPFRLTEAIRVFEQEKGIIEPYQAEFIEFAKTHYGITDDFVRFELEHLADKGDIEIFPSTTGKRVRVIKEQIVEELSI